MPAEHFMKKLGVSREKAEKINAAYEANKKERDVIDMDAVLKPLKIGQPPSIMDVDVVLADATE